MDEKQQKVECATKVAARTAKKSASREWERNCNVINTENLCFRPKIFLIFPHLRPTLCSPVDCQEKYHAYDMPCCVHFTGYSRQPKVSRAL
jgi:hypothetical protein